MPLSIFLTYDQVAERLHVPVATVRYWVSVGKITAFKPGRHPLVKQTDVETFVESNELGKLRAERARRTRTARGVAPTRAAPKVKLVHHSLPALPQKVA